MDFGSYVILNLTSSGHSLLLISSEWLNLLKKAEQLALSLFFWANCSFCFFFKGAESEWLKVALFQRAKKSKALKVHLGHSFCKEQNSKLLHCFLQRAVKRIALRRSLNKERKSKFLLVPLFLVSKREQKDWIVKIAISLFALFNIWQLLLFH